MRKTYLGGAPIVFGVLLRGSGGGDIRREWDGREVPHPRSLIPLHLPTLIVSSIVFSSNGKATRMLPPRLSSSKAGGEGGVSPKNECRNVKLSCLQQSTVSSPSSRSSSPSSL